MTLLGKYFDHRIGLATGTVLCIHAGLLASQYEGEFDWRPLSIALILHGFIAAIIAARCFQDLFGRSRIGYAIAGLAVVVMYSALARYRMVTGTNLDYALVGQNWRSAVQIDGAGLLASSFGAIYGSLLLLLIVAFGIAEWRLGALTWSRPAAPQLPKFLTTASLFLALVLSPVTSNELVTNLAWSAVRYGTLEQSEHAASYVEGTYPFVRSGAPPRARDLPEPGSKPNIFIIALESFSAHFVERKTPDGREYTPRFNQLISQGLFVERFYGNSIQTARGHFAIACSILPGFRESKTGPSDLRLRCLPEVLHDAGYATHYFQGHWDISFDDTEQTARKLGFTDIHAMPQDPLPGDEPYHWGWGPEDHIVYRELFRRLDAARASSTTTPRPVFAFVATINNHMNFDKVPPDRRFMYPDATTQPQRYANSLYLMDMHLQSLMSGIASREYLKDSIVVLVGDHGFPTGQHGMTFPEGSFHEEFFRTPLLVLWPGKLAARRITSAPASQLDIAPTLLELAGIRPQRHHFQGQSLLETLDPARAVHMAQPYHGPILVTVSMPWKYVHNLGTGESWLFNLQRDPAEEHNLYASPPDPSVLGALTSAMEFAFLNQTLLERNRIWPE